MKIIFLSAMIFYFSYSVSFSQIQRNPLIEILTGTWCEDCPCGEEAANSINLKYPKSVILVHHYWYGLDPFGSTELDSFTVAMQYIWLPSAFIDRAYPPPAFNYDKWDSVVAIRQDIKTAVDLSIEGTVNPGTRELNFTIKTWTIENLTGYFKLVVIITEDSLIANQAGNVNCPGGQNFIHNFVVRDFISYYRGDPINNVGEWSSQDTISKSFNYVVPSSYRLDKNKIIAYVFKDSSVYNVSDIFQAKKWDLFESLILDINEQIEYPTTYLLKQNFPNPFNPSTKIIWQSPVGGYQTLKVYDVLGNEVATLINEYRNAGSYEIDFDASKLSSGVYFYQLKVGEYLQTRKMVLMK